MTAPQTSAAGERRGSATSPVADHQLTEAHWQAAADAVTGQPTEALRVAAFARAIADAEQRGPSQPTWRPGITSFVFETPPTQDEVRARLTALEQAKHAGHVDPDPFCYLCPSVQRNPRAGAA